MKSIAQFWVSAIVPTPVDYIRIPAKSPHFDKDWAKNGHIEAAVTLAADGCGKHPVEGMQSQRMRARWLMHRKSQRRVLMALRFLLIEPAARR